MTDYFAQEHTTRRAVAVVTLLGVAVIHLVNDIAATWHENRTAFWETVILIAAALIVAELLTRYDSRNTWLAAGVLAAVAIVAFIVSRTSGLPGDGGIDKRNWTEPLGLAALLVESVLLLMVAAHFTTLHRRKG
jgi:hypothetical protein